MIDKNGERVAMTLQLEAQGLLSRNLHGPGPKDRARPACRARRQNVVNEFTMWKTLMSQLQLWNKAAS